MATSVVCNGPIDFTSSNGSLLSIPLTAIFFDTTGELKLKEEWLSKDNTNYRPNKEEVEKLLSHLRSTGIIAKSQQAAPVPAMVITAQTPGSAANSIEITFSKVVTDSAGVTTFDVTVTETNTYKGLTPTGPDEAIKEILGTPSNPGKRPGLVLVSSADDPELPKLGDYGLTGDPATVDITKNGTARSVAFTLQAKSTGADGALTKIAISNVDAAAKTFTLIATWTKSATGIQVGALESNFGYEITVSRPPGRTALAVPTKAKLSCAVVWMQQRQSLPR